MHCFKSGVCLGLVVRVVLSAAIFAMMTHVDIDLWYFDIWSFIAWVEVKLISLLIRNLLSHHLGMRTYHSFLVFIGMHSSRCSWSFSWSWLQFAVYLVINVFSWSLLNELAIRLWLYSWFVLLADHWVLELFLLISYDLLLTKSKALIAWPIPGCVLCHRYVWVWKEF